jgi:hypothetical protein
MHGLALIMEIPEVDIQLVAPNVHEIKSKSIYFINTVNSGMLVGFILDLMVLTQICDF